MSTILSTTTGMTGTRISTTEMTITRLPAGRME